MHFSCQKKEKFQKTIKFRYSSVIPVYYSFFVIYDLFD